MPDGLDLLTEIHGDVKYIKQALEKHVKSDEELKEEYIMPMWNSHQQAKGAAKLGAVIYTAIGGMIVMAADYLTRGNR